MRRVKSAPSVEHFAGVGKRKTSIARVYLRKGSGTIIVNNRPVDDYFRDPSMQRTLRTPLRLLDCESAFDARINVRGGGLSGQADAIRHGLARTLALIDPSNRGPLKKEQLLTRDSRKKERKKYGQRGARARFQFSKR